MKPVLLLYLLASFPQTEKFSTRYYTHYENKMIVLRIKRPPKIMAYLIRKNEWQKYEISFFRVNNVFYLIKCFKVNYSRKITLV